MAKSDELQISQSFIAQLIGDVIAAESRLASEDAQRDRRDLVRTRYAAIEGLVWIMREHVHTAASEMGYLTSLADLALRERTYIVTDAGHVKEHVRFAPLPQAVRLIARQAQLLAPELDVAFATSGWQALKDAAVVRNRVTHPKSLKDMTISTQDIEHVRLAMAWMLTSADHIMTTVNTSFASFNKQTKNLLHELQTGNTTALATYHAMLIGEKGN